ncbi:MAG: VCBS repeat-containing protein [Bacteroidales bacterium]|nr:VCBS repeat-containing protein [Bacteroidales bacterium]
MGWGAFLKNDGYGYYTLTDSIIFEFGFAPISGEFFDNNGYIDIFGRHQSSNPHKENIAIIYKYGQTQFNNIKVFLLCDNSVVIDDYSSGDINANGYNDIVFSCNNDFFWGIIYNDGTGNFSPPDYYNLSFPPLDIECADLNDDGKADVVVSGSKTEIYFSTVTGFQQQLLTETIGHDVLISDFDFMPFCSYAQMADFNNDFLPDMVFIAQDDSGIHIYYNQGDFILDNSQFVPINSYGSMLRRLECADLDKNGYYDLALVIYSHY